MSEHADAEIVPIVARWYDDADQWWFDRPEPVDPEVDHEPIAGSWVIEVPEAEWREWVAATATLDRLTSSWCDSAGLSPTEGCVIEPCSSFVESPNVDYSHLDPATAARLRETQPCCGCGRARCDHEPADTSTCGPDPEAVPGG